MTPSPYEKRLREIAEKLMLAAFDPGRLSPEMDIIDVLREELSGLLEAARYACSPKGKMNSWDAGRVIDVRRLEDLRDELGKFEES